MSWFDPDGLLRKFGTEKAVPNRAGEYKTYGAERVVEVRLDLTTLTSSHVIQSDQEFIPINMRVEEVEVIVQVAATSGGAPTLDVGLIQSSDRTTAISNTAFVAALALASIDQAGEKTVLRVGSTSAGALIGALTSTTQPGHIAARVNASTYTAGVVIIRIHLKRDI